MRWTELLASTALLSCPPLSEGDLFKLAKLSRLSKSAAIPLTELARAALRGSGGHGDVSDDGHLFEVALAKRTIIVTQDQSLLSRAGDLSREIAVEILRPGSALERFTHES